MKNHGSNLFHRNSVQNPLITSFEIITLHTSGMRHTAIYEIIPKESGAEISEYSIRYSHSEKERILERQVVIDLQRVLKLLNDCRILSWDGFSGAHPKGVLDGTMFTFEAIVNDGQKIYADGSQNFPKHYRNFTDGLYQFLQEEGA